MKCIAAWCLVGDNPGGEVILLADADEGGTTTMTSVLARCASYETAALIAAALNTYQAVGP